MSNDSITNPVRTNASVALKKLGVDVRGICNEYFVFDPSYASHEAEKSRYEVAKKPPLHEKRSGRFCAKKD